MRLRSVNWGAMSYRIVFWSAVGWVVLCLAPYVYALMRCAPHTRMLRGKTIVHNRSQFFLTKIKALPSRQSLSFFGGN